MSRLTPLLLVVLLACCSTDRDGRDQAHGVYYWRTDLCLDSTERAFLRTYDIKKVYCRYFDVVMEEISSRYEVRGARYEEPRPNATMTFSDTLPEGIEIVPTVYITEDCMHEEHKGLAAKLVKRIRQMNETNDIKGVREIQIDCDYTSRSRKTYYKFLEEVRNAWMVDGERWSEERGERREVSTTIRLHQLSMPAPPVDYGVLMLYNTGDPQKYMERNPILDIRDVAPYLSRLKDYPLPLAAAYPVYSWQRRIHGVRIEHRVEAGEILQVKAAVERRRPSLSHAIVTYHLDKENINRYDSETYEAIYRP